MIDLRPAADRMAGVATNVERQDLAIVSPCPDMTVGDLLDHVLMLTQVFTGVAQKHPGAPPGPPSAGQLPRTGARSCAAVSMRSSRHGPIRVPGMGKRPSLLGPQPATVAGMIVLDELVVHGWDLAAATGQPYDVILESEIEAAAQFVSSFPAPSNGCCSAPS